MLSLKINPLRILFRTAAGLAGLGVAAGIASHAGNALISSAAPTPLAFATANGMAYKPETQRSLQEFNDVRVIESGSKTHKLYCTVNFILCNKTEESGFGEIYSFVPDTLARALGMGPVIFLKPHSDMLHDYLLAHTADQHTGADQEKSLYAFNFSLFHELGHIWTSRMYGNEAYKAMPIPRRELKADRYAIPQLEREHGPEGKDYLYHFRALTQTDHDHDVLLSLLRPASQPEAPEDKDLDTHLSFRSLFRYACKTSAQQNEAPSAQNFHDLYACLRRNGITATPGASANPGMEIRTSRYVAAYEYFFPGSRP